VDQDKAPENVSVVMGQIERLRDILASRATGGQSYDDEKEYRHLRAVVRNNKEMAGLLPEWLREVRNLDEWWGRIKPLYGSYAERRAYLSREFDPVLTYIEDTYPGIVPIESKRPEPPPRPVAKTGGTLDTLGGFGAFFTAYDRSAKAREPTNLTSPTPPPSKQATGQGPKPASVRVFVVHGHDHGPRDSVARVIERLGFVAVILEEQPDGGLRTIIEKFEAYTDVQFAVVILTPDDMGGAKGGPAQPRARQNVILELGYFIGTLGRERVVAIVVGDMETPSDVGSTMYIKFDKDNAWKGRVAREMGAAGLPVDLNKLG
jgi:predicted nucleotide-binding protein